MPDFGYRNHIYSKVALSEKPEDTDYFLAITMG